MSARDSENLDNNDLSQGDDVYDANYDDVDSSSESSDEWSDDEQADIDDGAQQEPIKKKKSKSTLFIIIGVVFFAVIGFIFLSGGSSNQEVLQQVAEAPVINAETNATVVQPDPNVQSQSVDPVAIENQPNSEVPLPPPTEQTGILNDQNVVEKVENADEAGLAPIVPNQSLSEEKPIEAVIPEVQQGNNLSQENPVRAVDTTSQEPAKETNLVDVVTPNIKSVSDFPTADAIKKQEIVQNNTTDISIEEEKEPSLSQTILDEKDTKIGEIQSKLSEAQARIADLEKIISDKDATLVALNERKPDESIVDRTEEVETLKAKISELEKRISNPTISEDKENVDVSGNITNKSPSKKVTIVAQVTPLKVKPSWTLKSATSTKAIIYNKETGDLKTVSVGDYIDGLGKILDISQKNSLWIIKASKLTISE